MTNDNERTALVIGATGGVGGETARALLSAGWRVRALHRRPDEARRASVDARIEWVRGDAMDAPSVMAAARGAQVIVHGANPPGYKNWKGLALPMLESTIAAAKAVGARVVLPGTVYNYGPEALPRVRESAPQEPTTRKGAIRVQMEARLRESGVRTLILRAGDFFGPQTGNSWLTNGLLMGGKPARRVMYPGAPKVGHAWAYLPDLARTIGRLLDREADLETFATFHFRGHWFADGVEIAEATARSLERIDPARKPRVMGFPWFVIYLLAPFVETFREMIEMRWLWRSSLELVNEKLVAFLGEEPHTPLDVALDATLRGQGYGASAEPAVATRLARSSP